MVCSQTLMGAGHVLASFEGTAHRIYSGVTVTRSTPLPAGPKFFSPSHALGSSRRSPPCRDCIDCLGERGIYYHSPVRTDHTRSLVILTILFSTFKKHHLYTITQRKPLPWRTCWPYSMLAPRLAQLFFSRRSATSTSEATSRSRKLDHDETMMLIPSWCLSQGKGCTRRFSAAK